MIEVQNVVRTFKAGTGERFTAVDDLTFNISPGEVCCLLGPNGAGKTTTIMMILGFLDLTSGDIRVNETSVKTDRRLARSHISYIPDNIALYRNLSGYDNLRFFAELQGIEVSKDKIMELGERVGLPARALDGGLLRYSKGMKQRLAIAAALLKDASVFILDEPTTGLDPAGVKELIGIIKKLGEKGKAVLVTTHDLLHVTAFANSVRFLVAGKLARELQEDELKSANLENIYLELTGYTSENASL